MEVFCTRIPPRHGQLGLQQRLEASSAAAAAAAAEAQQGSGEVQLAQRQSPPAKLNGSGDGAGGDAAAAAAAGAGAGALGTAATAANGSNVSGGDGGRSVRQYPLTVSMGRSSTSSISCCKGCWDANVLLPSPANEVLCCPCVVMSFF